MPIALNVQFVTKMTHVKHHRQKVYFYVAGSFRTNSFLSMDLWGREKEIEVERNSNQLLPNRIKTPTPNLFSKASIFQATLSQQAASSKEEKTLTL